MDSYSSASSDSPSGTLTTSSSSYDDGIRYSQVVVRDIHRGLDIARRSIYVDLSILDQEYQVAMGRQYLPVGIWYDGVFYEGDDTLFEDGALPTLEIDRQSPLVEDALFTTWVDVMIGRIRGLLVAGRTEAQAALRLEIERWRII